MADNKCTGCLLLQEKLCRQAVFDQMAAFWNKCRTLGKGDLL